MDKKFDYYEWRVDMVSDEIRREMEFITGLEPLERMASEPYRTYLGTRLGEDRRPTGPQVYYDGRGKRREVEKINLDTYSREVDEIVYRKDWRFLKDIHRRIKIGEYVDGFEYPDWVDEKKVAANREKVKEKLIAGLNEKRYLKGKAEITYDKVAMKITEISSVTYSKKRGLYRVEW